MQTLLEPEALNLNWRADGSDGGVGLSPNWLCLRRCWASTCTLPVSPFIWQTAGKLNLCCRFMWHQHFLFTLRRLWKCAEVRSCQSSNQICGPPSRWIKSFAVRQEIAVNPGATEEVWKRAFKYRFYYLPHWQACCICCGWWKDEGMKGCFDRLPVCCPSSLVFCSEEDWSAEVPPTCLSFSSPGLISGCQGSDLLCHLLSINISPFYINTLLFLLKCFLF